MFNSTIQVINIAESFLSKTFDVKNCGSINVVLSIYLLKNYSNFALT